MVGALQAPSVAEFFGGVPKRVHVAAKLTVVPGQGVVQAETILVRGRGSSVQFCFQDDDLEPDVAAGAIKGAQEGLGGVLLLDGTAADDRGEQLLRCGRVSRPGQRGRPAAGATGSRPGPGLGTCSGRW